MMGAAGLVALVTLVSGPLPVPAGYTEGEIGGFLSLDQLDQDLQLLWTSHGDIVSEPLSIGTTWEGRDIWMIQLTAVPEEETAPAILYTALTHAREAVTLTTLHLLMWHLVEQYGVDPEVTEVLDTRRLYFVPMLNPDGWMFNQTTNPDGGGLWRKNRRDNGDGSFGVDLNRNFSLAFAHDDIGSSPETESNTYRGPAPFSEPESAALRDQAIALPELRMVLNLHSKGEVLLHPFGYAPWAFPASGDRGVYLQIAKTLASLPGVPTGNTIQATADFANGRAGDWLYGETSQKPSIVAFTPELGLETWWPDPMTALSLARTWGAVCLKAATFAPTRVTGSVTGPSELPVGGAQVRVPVLDTWLETDAEGDFQVLLPGPGDWTLEVSHPALETAFVPVVVSSAGETPAPLSVVLQPVQTAPVTGQVVDAPTTEPLVGATVRADTLPPMVATTDAEGGFVLPEIAMGLEVDLLIERPGYGPARRTAVAGAEPVEAALYPAATSWSFEVEDPGWTTGADPGAATTGHWVRTQPTPSWYDGQPAQPGEDQTSEAGTYAFVTGNWKALQQAGLSDVDGGTVTLRSPPIPVPAGERPMAAWTGWFFTSAPGSGDAWQVSVSPDADGPWTVVETTHDPTGGWSVSVHDLSALLPADVAAYHLRFDVTDEGPETLVEGALAGVTTWSVPGDGAPPADPPESLGEVGGEETETGVEAVAEPAADVAEPAPVAEEGADVTRAAPPEADDAVKPPPASDGGCGQVPLKSTPLPPLILALALLWLLWRRSGPKRQR